MAMSTAKDMADLDDEATYDELTEAESVCSGSVNDVLDAIPVNDERQRQREDQLQRLTLGERQRQGQLDSLTFDLDVLLDQLAIPDEVDIPGSRVDDKYRVVRKGKVTFGQRNIGNGTEATTTQKEEEPVPTAVFDPYQDSVASSALGVRQPSLVARTPPRPPTVYKGFDPRRQDLSIVKLNHPLNTVKSAQFNSAKSRGQQQQQQPKARPQFDESAMSNSDKMLHEYMNRIHEREERHEVNSDVADKKPPPPASSGRRQQQQQQQQQPICKSRSGDNLLANEFMLARQLKFGMGSDDDADEDSANREKGHLPNYLRKELVDYRPSRDPKGRERLILRILLNCAC
ncbi:unnamed protein product [Sphagnum tenellum]